jgi:hypothetical protein
MMKICAFTLEADEIFSIITWSWYGFGTELVRRKAFQNYEETIN